MIISSPFPDILLTSVGSEIHYGPKLVADTMWDQHLDYRWEPDAVVECLDEIAGLDLEPIYMNPDADVRDLRPFLPDLDMVLVMSVFPGFGGQEFLPAVLDGVRALRQELDFRGEIEMDGGLGPDTIGSCAQAGANVPGLSRPSRDRGASAYPQAGSVWQLVDADPLREE